MPEDLCSRARDGMANAPRVSVTGVGQVEPIQEEGELNRRFRHHTLVAAIVSLCGTAAFARDRTILYVDQTATGPTHGVSGARDVASLVPVPAGERRS